MECCICSKELHTENPRTYFCSSCYKLWKDVIKARTEWVTYLINLEANRRYHDKMMARLGITTVYLGDDDLYQNAGRYKVSHKFNNDQTI